MIWDASDANPMHRRIPAEVVSRRKPRKVQQEQEKVDEEVFVDLKAVVGMKPEAKVKWLSKAFKMVSDGKEQSTELYNIIVSRKFVSGLSERIAKKLVAIVREGQELFSEKQQRYLNSHDCPLMAIIASRDAVEGGADRDEAEGDDGRDRDAATDRERDAAAAAARDADDVLAALEARRTRAAEERRADREKEREKEQQQLQDERKTPIEDRGGKSSWQVAEDEAALRRQAALKQEVDRKEVARREEKRRKQEQEEEAARRKAKEAEEEERRRKLEEEADDIFNQAFKSKPPTSLALMPQKRSRSRSRSISSRTARRNNRKQAPAKRESWSKNGVVSGSRAIFLNRDFVEDLPHMPRPAAPGIQGLGPVRRDIDNRDNDNSRSRSRDRRRRK